MTQATSTTQPKSVEEMLESLGPPPDFSNAPVVVFWETTKACALRCLHCRATAQPRRNPNELDTQEGFSLLSELATVSPPPVVILTGGDPFMRRDIFDLLGFGLKLGLRMSLSPSVTKLVTPEVLAKLTDVGLSRLSFSLDGASAEAHDAFRGVRRSFDQTLERIQDALDVGLSLQINTTVSRPNREELPEIAALLQTFPKMVLWDLFFLVPTGRGQRDDVISPEEHEEVFQWMHSLSRSVPFGIKTTLGQHYRRVVLQNAFKEGNGSKEELTRLVRASSNDGKGVCFISHLGDVSPSGFLPLPRGNVREQSILDIYRNDIVFQILRDPNRLRGKCGECPFRAICGGSRSRAYAFTGDYLAQEPCCVFEPDATKASTN